MKLNSLVYTINYLFLPHIKYLKTKCIQAIKLFKIIVHQTWSKYSVNIIQNISGHARNFHLGTIARRSGDGSPLWGPGAKSPRRWSSLNTWFTNCDCRNDKNVKILAQNILLQIEKQCIRQCSSLAIIFHSWAHAWRSHWSLCVYLVGCKTRCDVKLEQYKLSR